MHERQAYFIQYRVRYAYFRSRSVALYRRYSHVSIISLALFGVLLTERPSLLAEPLLQFWRAPHRWQENITHVGGWFAIVAIWASIHREFIRGGALSMYCRSLAVSRRAAALVDLSVLCVSLQIFLVPFAVALWIAMRAGNFGGADGRFCLYLALFAALTVSVSRSAVFGSSLRTRLAQGGAFIALVFSQQLPSALSALALLAAALVNGIAAGATPPAQHAGTSRTKPAAGKPPGALMLLRLQCELILQRHPYAAAMRLLLAALPQFASWWLIVRAGKHDDSKTFVQIACALSTCLTSGFFYTLFASRQALQPYLRSIAFGGLRMAFADHLLVAATTGLLLGVSLSVLAIALGPNAEATTALLHASLYWLAWLPLLGLPVIQRHKDGILMKFSLVIVALMIVFNS